MTPAMWACYFNKPANLQILRNALERVDPRSDAIFDERDNIGRTVLHWAAMFGDQSSNLSCLKVDSYCSTISRLFSVTTK